MAAHILIVDDSSTNLYMLESLLKGHGFDVTSAENGKDALEKARLTPPDLVVTDILMPVMDGYALCREWKSDETLKEIPLIFYTATYTESKDEAFALGLGADRFILKPEEPDVLIAELREVLDTGYAAKQVAPKPLGEEMEYFRQYNEILFTKLEKKMVDLETANRELRALEERYRLSFENASDVICAVDTDLVISDISPSLQRLLGYHPDDLIGQSIPDLGYLFTAASFEQLRAEMSVALQGEIITGSIHQLITKGGELKEVEISKSPMERDNGIVGVICVGRDITDRRRAEEALRESEKKYRLLADNANDVIFVLDMDLNYTYISPSVKILRGFDPEDVVGTSASHTLTPPSWKTAMETFAEVMEREKTEPVISRTLELEMKRKDGTIVWTEVKASFIRNEDQRPVRILGVTRDITDRKRVEAHRQETLDALRKAVETTIQVMVSTVEARDPYTAGHQLQVANLARAIAEEMELPPEQIDGIVMASSIHDIGKLAVPAEILTKPGRLSDVEFAMIQEHPRGGYEILKNVESDWPLAEIVYQHHERMDGSGYPRNLKGDEILIEARILAVADVVEAMGSHRPYRSSLGLDAALDEVAGNRDILYDPAVVDACLRLFREKGYTLA